MAEPAVPQHLAEITAFITYVSRLATSEAVRRRVAGSDRTLTSAETAALRAVADAGPFTFKDLAEHLSLDQTTISRTANRLLELGLLRREVDPDDRRKAWLTATTDGHELLHRLQTVAVQWYEVAVSEWTAEEQRALGATLHRLQHDMQRLEFDRDGRAVGLVPEPELPPSPFDPRCEPEPQEVRP